MVEVIDTSNNDDLSAFLTALFISKTLKVESSRVIADIWDKLRKQLVMKDSLDFLSIILASGRFMDIKEELDHDEFIEMLNDLTSIIGSNLKGRGHTENIHESALITAMISSAYISRSPKIETINQIIDDWERTNKEIIVKTPVEQLAGLLTIGRIMENEYKLEDIKEIIEVHKNLINELSDVLNDGKIKQIYFAAAFLANAYIEVTPHVERVQEIIVFWLEVQKDLVVVDHLDYIASILTYGRVKDLKNDYFLNETSISEIKNNIRRFIETKV